MGEEGEIESSCDEIPRTDTRRAPAQARTSAAGRFAKMFMDQDWLAPTLAIQTTQWERGRLKVGCVRNTIDNQHIVLHSRLIRAKFHATVHED